MRTSKKNLNTKLEEKMGKAPFYIKTKQENSINIVVTGQGGFILIKCCEKVIYQMHKKSI